MIEELQICVLYLVQLQWDAMMIFLVENGLYQVSIQEIHWS
jgi:hypothetical protein